MSLQFLWRTFSVLKTNLKNTSVTSLIHAQSWHVPRSSSRLSCFQLRGEKDQHSEALNSVPDSEGSVPEQQAHILQFLNCKLDAFGHISSCLVPVPCLHHFWFTLSTLFFSVYFPIKLSPSVSQCAYPTTRLHCLLHLGLISELQFLSSTDLFHTPDLLSCILLFVPCQFQFLSSDKTSCNLRSFPSYNFQYDMSNFWTYQHTEEWLESSSDPYSKLNLSPMLAPSKAFFLFALLGLMQRPPHNTVPEGRCQRHPKESKALHSRDMSLNTRQAGAQFSVLKLNPVPLLKQFR